MCLEICFKSLLKTEMLEVGNTNSNTMKTKLLKMYDQGSEPLWLQAQASLGVSKMCAF